MSLHDHKAFILASFRGARGAVQNESEIWRSIEAAVAAIRPHDQRKRDQKRWADEMVKSLGLVYADQTGSLPGFTNSENETRFERFARAVMAADGEILSRNLIKAAIRRLNAKANPEFRHALDQMRAKIAAE
jgi:hypothetical protein